MRTGTIFWIILVIALSTALYFGLRQKSSDPETKASMPYPHRMVTIDDRYDRISATGDTLAKGYAQFTIPVFEDENLNRLIKNDLSPDKTYEEFVRENTDTYKRYLDDYPDGEISGGMAGNHYSATASVYSESPTLLQIQYFTDIYYTGAAHGQYGENYWIYNKHRQEPVRLSDLFASPEELTRLAEVVFRKQENLPEQSSLCDGYLFEDCKFKLAEEFRLDPEAMNFVYNPYEGKPYSEGIWMVALPYDEILPLMKPEFAKLIEEEIRGR